MLRHIIKRLVEAYQAKRLAKYQQENARHNLNVATEFYYSKD